jgi:Spy/CpxP family protein refolding chaperone
MKCVTRLVLSLWCVSLLAMQGFAQEATSGSKGADGKAKAVARKAAAAKKGSKSRLPNYYGKLDLEESQKTQIYAIRDKYRADIEKLEQQLEELRNKESQEIEAVLKPEQKTKLSEALEAAKKKRSAKKAKGASATTQPASSTTTK